MSKDCNALNPQQSSPRHPSYVLKGQSHDQPAFQCCHLTLTATADRRVSLHSNASGSASCCKFAAMCPQSTCCAGREHYLDLSQLAWAAACCVCLPPAACHPFLWAVASQDAPVPLGAPKPQILLPAGSPMQHAVHRAERGSWPLIGKHPTTQAAP